MSRIQTTEERDVSLIEAFSRGDMAGFRYVYSLHRQRVMSYCLYYMGDRAAAEDAFQEAFTRIYTRREQLREAKALTSWVLLITRSVCLNLLRESKFTPQFVPLETTDEAQSFSDTLETAAVELDQVIADDLLRAALAKIPPMYRDAFLLCEFEGHDYPAIAEMTNTTEMNVRGRVARAKKQLRILLAPHYRREGSLGGRKSRTRNSKRSYGPEESEFDAPEDVSRGTEEVFAR